MQKYNKLYISQHEALTETGFLSRNIGKILQESGDTVVEYVPDFSAMNTPNFLSKSSGYVDINQINLDTIIQYVPLELSEYFHGYTNIFIYSLPHFITRNKSIVDKLKIFDELWLLDKNSYIFLDNTDLQRKAKVVGYPYIPSEMRGVLGDIENHQNNSINFYTISNKHQLENLEILILNFLTVFNKTDDVRLVIYIDSIDNEIESVVSQTIERIKCSLRHIEASVVDDLIVIMVGDAWSNIKTMKRMHSDGDCYINVDYCVNPHVLTAFHLNKHIISICNIDNIIELTESHIIKTYRGSFKYQIKSSNKIFYNEYNIYPKILDESLKDKLLMIYSSIKKNMHSTSGIKSFNYNNYFNDSNIKNIQ